MNDNSIKEKEKRAFWIGLGTIVAGFCIIIAIINLIFSGGGDDEKQVRGAIDSNYEQTTQESKQKDRSNKEEKEQEELVENEETVTEPKAESETTEESGSEQTYKVQAGDTLFEIGLKYGVDWQDILGANDLDEDSVIAPGDELTIPN